MVFGIGDCQGMKRHLFNKYICTLYILCIVCTLCTLCTLGRNNTKQGDKGDKGDKGYTPLTLCTLGLKRCFSLTGKKNKKDNIPPSHGLEPHAFETGEQG